MAVEAACRDRYFTRALTAGTPRHVVEATWTGKHKTRDRLLLAIAKDQPGFDQWLRTPYRQEALGIVSSGAHRGLYGDAFDAVEKSTRLVDDIEL